MLLFFLVVVVFCSCISENVGQFPIGTLVEYSEHYTGQNFDTPTAKDIEFIDNALLPRSDGFEDDNETTCTIDNYYDVRLNSRLLNINREIDRSNYNGRSEEELIEELRRHVKDKLENETYSFDLFETLDIIERKMNMKFCPQKFGLSKSESRKKDLLNLYQTTSLNSLVKIDNASSCCLVTLRETNSQWVPNLQQLELDVIKMFRCINVPFVLDNHFRTEFASVNGYALKTDKWGLGKLKLSIIIHGLIHLYN